MNVFSRYKIVIALVTLCGIGLTMSGSVAYAAIYFMGERGSLGGFNVVGGGNKERVIMVGPDGKEIPFGGGATAKDPRTDALVPVVETLVPAVKGATDDIVQLKEEIELLKAQLAEDANMCWQVRTALPIIKTILLGDWVSVTK